MARRSAGERKRARALRIVAYERQGGLCAWCLSFVPEVEATADHLVDWCEGGRATRENIVMACEPCNQLRSRRISSRTSSRVDEETSG